MTAPRRTDCHGAGRTVALTLVVLPLFAIPSFLLGQGIADSLDDDRTNGVLALGLMLGVGLPGMTSIVLARWWGELSWTAALALGIGSGVASAGAVLAFFVAACTATNCVV